MKLDVKKLHLSQNRWEFIDDTHAPPGLCACRPGRPLSRICFLWQNNRAYREAWTGWKAGKPAISEDEQLVRLAEWRRKHGREKRPCIHLRGRVHEAGTIKMIRCEPCKKDVEVFACLLPEFGPETTLYQCRRCPGFVERPA
jgi:hypothetical protein